MLALPTLRTQAMHAIRPMHQVRYNALFRHILHRVLSVKLRRHVVSRRLRCSKLVGRLPRAIIALHLMVTRVRFVVNVAQ